MDYDDQKPAATAPVGGGEDDGNGTDISFDTADDHDGGIVNDGGAKMMPTGGMIGAWPGEGGGGDAFATLQGDACVVVPGGGATMMPSINPFMTNLVISDVREKNANGALLCLVVGCSKNAQGRSFVPARTAAADDANGNGNGNGNEPPAPRGGGRFCRSHHNAYLIQTGQVESWGCACGNRVVAESDRCGTCHRWRGGIKQHGKSGAEGKAPAKKRAKKASLPPSSAAVAPYPFQGLPPARAAALAASELRISDVRETNKNGRSLCKVVGCDKLDQARNEGYCRRHYKMIAVVDGPPSSSSAAACHDAGEINAAGGFIDFLGGGGGGAADVDTVSWICPCGQVISFKQKRCGKCNKWKGGMRDPYKVTTSAKKRRVLPSDDDVVIKDENGGDASTSWTCQCGTEVSAAKSRCGQCHHWRGGKRRGGWTIRPKSDDARDDHGIDWAADWTCCGEVISAEKRRCGKCNGWRGGKRVAKAPLKLGEVNLGDEYASEPFNV